jgi:aromatic ring-opening dioxygenase catalytic subunit (LigB family)
MLVHAFPLQKPVLCATVIGVHIAVKLRNDLLTLIQPQDRQKALYDLVKHPGFRPSHPREDHFVPLYVAAGAGEGQKDEEMGEVRIICGMYGMISAAFGV